jgi:predicted metalloendopeptidase
VSTPELKHLLDQVPDTREIVLRRERTWSADHDAWRDACEDTWAAYRGWRLVRTRDSYLTYRAAQDREDAAHDTLAQTQMSRTTVS